MQAVVNGSLKASLSWSYAVWMLNIRMTPYTPSGLCIYLRYDEGRSNLMKWHQGALTYPVP
jgi:hypothetical protein